MLSKEEEKMTKKKQKEAHTHKGKIIMKKINWPKERDESYKHMRRRCEGLTTPFLLVKIIPNSRPDTLFQTETTQNRTIWRTIFAYVGEYPTGKKNTITCMLVGVSPCATP